MELWIRSQDREMLYKAHELYYYRCVDAHSIQVNHENFGKYKTKERALEVLDEIQKVVGWIQKDMKYTTIGDINHLIGCYDNYVYEMPQE